ncbi:hypothetical protein V8E52_009402 [Russula decolorans]
MPMARVACKFAPLAFSTDYSLQHLIFTLSRSPNACRQTGSNVNVMDVIYILGGVPPFLLGLPFSRPPVLTAPPFRLLAMALCTTDQLLESSSVAAPTATTQPDAVASGEELSSQGIGNDNETSDTSGPPNPSPVLASDGPVDMNVALDLFHFFTGVKPARRGIFIKEETPPLKTNSEKYGGEKSKLPDGATNYIYGPRTGNANLRRHLYQMHAEEYDKAVLQHKWTYKLSSELGTPVHDA